MDPISLIVGALVAGASESAKETASELVRDSYAGMKALVVRYWKQASEKEDESAVLIRNLESKPELYREVVEAELRDNMPQPNSELIELAQKMMHLIDGEGYESGKYKVTIDKAQGVQVGDHNTQHNNFN